MKRAAWAFVVSLAAACTSFDSPDATPSASDAGDAGGETSTPTTHTFFDDFDHGALGATWTQSIGGAPVTFALDSTKASSPPSALHATLPKGTNGYTKGAYLSKRFDRSTKSLTCGARIFVVKHTELASPSIVDVVWRVPSNTTYAAANADFSISGGGGSVAINQEGAGPSTYPAASLSIRTGEWLPFAIAIDADARTVAVTVDGKPYVNGMYPAPVRPNEGFDIKLGLFETSDEDSVEVLFDDFYCDVIEG